MLRRQFLAGDGKDVLYKGFVFLYCLIHSEGGTHVAHHASDVDRQLATRNTTSGDSIDKLFFCALRVLQLQWFYDDAFELSRHLAHHTNRLGFVVLDADICIRNTKGFSQDADTNADFLGMLQHHPVVGGEVWLTLYRIDDKVLGFFTLGYTVFDVCRERSTAKSNNTHLFQFVYYLLRLEVAFSFDVWCTVDGFHPLVAFNVDIDGRLCHTERIFADVNLAYRSRNRRVYIGTHKCLCFSDKLTHLNLVTLCHYRSGRCTKMLIH